MITKYYYKKPDGKCIVSFSNTNKNGYEQITKAEYDEWFYTVYPPQTQTQLIHQPRELTQAELELRAKKREIAQLKRKLAETDYCVIKIAEGVATSEEYAEVLVQRQQWRARINQLEQ